MAYDSQRLSKRMENVDSYFCRLFEFQRWVWRETPGSQIANGKVHFIAWKSDDGSWLGDLDQNWFIQWVYVQFRVAKVNGCKDCRAHAKEHPRSCFDSREVTQIGKSWLRGIQIKWESFKPLTRRSRSPK